MTSETAAILEALVEAVDELASAARNAWCEDATPFSSRPDSDLIKSKIENAQRHVREARELLGAAEIEEEGR